jgi:hypothetical protein
MMRSIRAANETNTSHRSDSMLATRVVALLEDRTCYIDAGSRLLKGGWILSTCGRSWRLVVHEKSLPLLGSMPTNSCGEYWAWVMVAARGRFEHWGGRIRTSIWRIRIGSRLSEPQNLFSFEFINPSKRSNFENRIKSAQSRASEINGPFGE